HPRVECEAMPRRDAAAGQLGDGRRGFRVTHEHALIVAMRRLGRKQRHADVVGAGNDLDFLAMRQPRGDPVVIDAEGGRVALADIGQHAEQVMGAKPDRHEAEARAPAKRLAMAMVQTASAALMTAPTRNGVTPKASALAGPTKVAS